MLTPKVLPQWMFALVCLCSLGILFSCNSTVVNSNWSHGFVLCVVFSGLTGICDTWTGDGSLWTSYLAFEQHWFWKVYEFLRDETLGDSLHGGHWSVLRFLDAVLLVPELKAEVTFYAVFIGGGWSQLLCFSAWRVIWMQLSDRVAGGRIWISLVHAALIRTAYEVFFYCPSCTAHNWEDIMQKALMLFGHSFTAAICKLWNRTLAISFAFWKIGLQTLILWTSKGGVEICCLGAPSTIQCNKWISGKCDIADYAATWPSPLWASRDFMQNGTVGSEFGGYLVGLWLTTVINLQFWILASCLSTKHCALQHNAVYVAVVVFGTPWDLRYCPLDTYLPWVSWWEWPRHCPCTLWCGHQLSWWPGTILGTWCFIGKHCFSFSSAWGVWPLLLMYIRVSIFNYGSWTWTLHYDWDFRFPSCIFCIWWVCFVWLSGDFIEILRTVFTGSYVM